MALKHGQQSLTNYQPSINTNNEQENNADKGIIINYLI